MIREVEKKMKYIGLYVYCGYVIQLANFTSYTLDSIY